MNVSSHCVELLQQTWPSAERGRFTSRRTTRSFWEPSVSFCQTSRVAFLKALDILMHAMLLGNKPWDVWSHLIWIPCHDCRPLTHIFVLLFLSALPEDVIKMAKDVKPVTEIQQNGKDFTITSKTPGKTVTNSFTIGKEAEITTMDGKKLKVQYVYIFSWCWTVQEELISSTEAQFHKRSRVFLNQKKNLIYIYMIFLNALYVLTIGYINLIIFIIFI